MLHTKLNDRLVLWTYTIMHIIFFKKAFLNATSWRQGGRGGSFHTIQYLYGLSLHLEFLGFENKSVTQIFIGIQLLL